MLDEEAINTFDQRHVLTLLLYDTSYSDKAQKLKQSSLDTPRTTAFSPHTIIHEISEELIAVEKEGILPLNRLGMCDQLKGDKCCI